MKDIPHQSIIHIIINKDIFESLPSGQVSTKSIKNESEKHTKVFTAIGNTLDECKQKTQKLLTNILAKLQDDTLI
jgi:hypothetical protein